jgi:hypothetical protein
MSNDGHNSVSLDAVWMDMLRSLAIFAVVIHHLLLFNPYSSSLQIFTTIADLIQTLAGTVVHLFFIFVLRYRVFSWHVHWLSIGFLSKAVGSARGFKNVLIFVLARFISPLMKLTRSRVTADTRGRTQTSCK